MSRRPVWFSRDPLLDWVMIILCLSVGAAYVVSPFPARSLQALENIGLGLLAYVLLAKLPLSERRLRWLTLALVACGGGLASLAALTLGPVQTVLPWRVSHAVQLGLLPMTGANPNVLAGALVTLMPFPLVLLSRQTEPNTRRVVEWVGGIVIASAIALAVVVTRSAGALFGMICGLAVVTYYLWPKASRMIVPILVVATLALGSIMGWRSLIDAVLADAVDGGLPVRLEIWSRALRILADFPLSGPGLGCFEHVVRLTYPLFLVRAGTVTHAHNLFLQVGVDLGILGLVNYAALLFIVVHRLVGSQRAYLSVGNTRLQRLSEACLASIVGMCAHGLVDAAVWDNRIAFIPWVILGLSTVLFRVSSHALETAVPESREASSTSC